MDPAIEALLSQYADNPQDNQRLADEIARMKAAQAAAMSSAAPVPVQRQPLTPPKMRGDGSPVANKGIQGQQPADSSPSRSMDEYLQSSLDAQHDFKGVVPGTKPAQETTNTNPMSAVNGYQNGAGPSFAQKLSNTGQNTKAILSMLMQRKKDNGVGTIGIHSQR